MEEQPPYEPPEVWVAAEENGGKFAKTNRPIAGPTHDKDLPTGDHPLQLYSLGTPNGVKVTIMLEELLGLGHLGAEYDAHIIRIGDGDQFGSGFVDINPNSKIPAMIDWSGAEPVRIFESGSILLYLAEKFGAFIPKDVETKAECMSWLFWLTGSAPYLGGGFGHFYHYAPVKIKYAVDRFAMETKRQLDVLDRHLADHAYLAGDEYSIADIATWPWYGVLALGRIYDAGAFLDVQSYRHVQRWTTDIGSREAVIRGRMINRTSGEPEEQMEERHGSSDYAGKTGVRINS